MCTAHGNAFHTIRTRRCMICTSRRYVPRVFVQQNEPQIEREKEEQRVEADSRHTLHGSRL